MYCVLACLINFTTNEKLSNKISSKKLAQFETIQLKDTIDTFEKHNYALRVMSQGAEIQFFRREGSSSTVPRRCNVFTKEPKGREKAKGCTYLSIFQTDVRQRVILCATRCIRSTWESQSVPEIDREATGLARVLPRRLSSTFVALAAFIDGKSAVDSRSKISKGRKRGVTSVVDTVDVLHGTWKNSYEKT